MGRAKRGVHAGVEGFAAVLGSHRGQHPQIFSMLAMPPQELTQESFKMLKDSPATALSYIAKHKGDAPHPYQLVRVAEGVVDDEISKYIEGRKRELQTLGQITAIEPVYSEISIIEDTGKFILHTRDFGSDFPHCHEEMSASSSRSSAWCVPQIGRLHEQFPGYKACKSCGGHAVRHPDMTKALSETPGDEVEDRLFGEMSQYMTDLLLDDSEETPDLSTVEDLYYDAYDDTSVMVFAMLMAEDADYASRMLKTRGMRFEDEIHAKMAVAHKDYETALFKYRRGYMPGLLALPAEINDAANEFDRITLSRRDWVNILIDTYRSKGVKVLG